MLIEQLHDHNELAAFLTRDRIGNAYLLGDLDPAYEPYCTWFGIRDDESLELHALALLYTGLSLPALLTVAGRNEDDEDTRSAAVAALGRLLSTIVPDLPRTFWTHTWEHHRPAFDEHYNTHELQRMTRMGLARSDYQAQPREFDVRRLSHADTAAIMEVYQHYPDNFFEPYQLETGLYFGISGDGRHASGADGLGLAAIAGIHVHSRTYDIAAIGNLVVHPDYRRKHYGGAVTGRLLDELFETVSLVTLNVQQDNVAAIRLFEKFGFNRHHTYFEGRVELKH